VIFRLLPTVCELATNPGIAAIGRFAIGSAQNHHTSDVERSLQRSRHAARSAVQCWPLPAGGRVMLTRDRVAGKAEKWAGPV